MWLNFQRHSSSGFQLVQYSIFSCNIPSESIIDMFRVRQKRQIKNLQKAFKSDQDHFFFITKMNLFPKKGKAYLSSWWCPQNNAGLRHFIYIVGIFAKRKTRYGVMANAEPHHLRKTWRHSLFLMKTWVL